MMPEVENLKQLLTELEKGKDVLSHSFEKCRKIPMAEGLSYEEMESVEKIKIYADKYLNNA